MADLSMCALCYEAVDPDGLCGCHCPDCKGDLSEDGCTCPEPAAVAESPPLDSWPKRTPSACTFCSRPGPVFDHFEAGNIRKACRPCIDERRAS